MTLRKFGNPPTPFEDAVGGLGGGGGKGGGKQRQPVEQPDNLQSTQVAKLVDVLSEGPIKGLVEGSKSIYLDGVRLQNADGSYNWQNAVIQTNAGWPGQPIMQGFAYQSAETAVSVQLRYNQPAVRTIVNPDVDRARLTFSTPTLQTINKTSGDISGATVTWQIEIQTKGAGYVNLGQVSISGKTTSQYQRSVLVGLPGGNVGAPWDIRVRRLTADSTSDTLQNDLYWESMTEIIDDRVNYHLSACVGVMITADQFNAIPKRIYEVEGLYCYVPNNYDAYAGTYNGVWNGNWAYSWTENPAWVLWDILTNNRYGLGDFISWSEVDKWSFYKVAQWCDQLVQDGRGGTERRWTCNVQIMNRVEAFDLLQQFAGIFRGFMFWQGGIMTAVADQPSDPVEQFTNANVISGVFNYSSSDIRERHTQIVVGWRDPALLGETRFAITEDPDAVSKYGLQTLEIDAIACDSETQALRIGKWTLFSELYEGETVSFSTGLQTSWVRPGDIIRVADINVGGERRGGRIREATTTRIVLDGPVKWAGGTLGYALSVQLPNGAIETRYVSTMSADPFAVLTLVAPPLSAAPAVNTTWVLSSTDLQPTLWRVLDVSQSEPDQYKIEASRHRPDKWGYVENNLPLSEPDISNILAVPPPVTDFKVTEYLVELSPISVGVRATISWKSDMPSFDLGYRDTGRSMNWSVLRTDQHAYDLPVTEGNKWDFQVTPVSPLGVKGPTSTISKSIVGRLAPPLPPTRLRAKVANSIVLFDWAPSTELDVRIGGHFELRYSSLVSGATWASAQQALPSIPGSATSAEVMYRIGTWMLRTFDAVGQSSATWATVLTVETDQNFRSFARICENPDWEGTFSGTELLQPQNWLVLGQTGGLVDDQFDMVDDWSDVDVLPYKAGEDISMLDREGFYVFENIIDAGGVFTVRFAADILAFPYNEFGDYFDARLESSDSWSDWDNLDVDLEGAVHLYIRTTNDDPSMPGPSWTAWSEFAPMEYTGRAFQFMAQLTAPAGQNIGIETLCVTADLRNKYDAGEDLPYAAVRKSIVFHVKFYLVPAVVVTVQDALSSDNVTILNKTREGFDIEIKNGSGVHQTRVFDWHAQGF